ncbi:hypothetical protein WJX72_000661 [[Myrmecia] bisecta]|uniref:Dynamin-type G domain-containing protein n=1 Tax=[Myrmecia] bisecta TaxID=41462 RepID=A0AAW1PFK0_9CHLO
MSQAADLFDNTDSKVRYEAFSRLQAAAVAFGESLPIPELVAVGGQSDSKSSLVEAFLGFRFNVREVEMGTRRPLVIQMVHDPTAQTPRCRLQDEDSDEYGPPIVPETAVAEAIREMTDKHLRQMGSTVSAKPIVMRAEYAFCPNLTIIDTPGFILKARKGEPESMADDIKNMVRAQIAAPHRLILFLQQSSVEWCSSLWLHVIQEVDPNFMRTVVVASKFDNRLKEFAERWEVDRYLAASGYLPAHVKPFFVALPKDRTLTSSSEWRKQIQEVDASVFAHMRSQIVGGFNEERFGSHIGFGNLKRYLEDELARRYRDAAPATLSLLQERCEAVAGELVAADAQLQAATDVASLRRAASQHVFAVSTHIAALLQGATDPDPAQHGLTTEEERAAGHAPQWPGVAGPVHPVNAELRLYGGAAFERCLQEFQEAVQVLGFPTVARDKVANVLLAYKARGQGGGSSKVAQDIARHTAKELLAPLLVTACGRLAAVLRRAFDVAAESSALMNGACHQTLRAYVAFHAGLRCAYQAFIGRLEQQCRQLVHHHLDAATSEFAVGMLAELESTAGHEDAEGGSRADDAQHQIENAMREVVMEDVAAPTREPLRESQMTVPETPSPDLLATANKTIARRHGLALAGRNVDNDSPGRGRVTKLQRTAYARASAPSDALTTSYSGICSLAERIFERIRHSVASQAVPGTLKAAFLEPISSCLAAELALDLLARTDDDFMSMFTASGAVAVLEAKRDALSRRVEGLIKCKNEFQELARCL